MILRELDLLKHPNLSLRHLAQDGVFGKCLPLTNFVSKMAHQIFLRKQNIDQSLKHKCIFLTGSSNFEQEEQPTNRQEYVLPIELNVRVGPHLHLRDSFHWDLTNPDNSPEEFAAVLVSDFLHQEGA